MNTPLRHFNTPQHSSIKQFSTPLSRTPLIYLLTFSHIPRTPLPSYSFLLFPPPLTYHPSLYQVEVGVELRYTQSHSPLSYTTYLLSYLLLHTFLSPLPTQPLTHPLFPSNTLSYTLVTPRWRRGSNCGIRRVIHPCHTPH